MKINQKERILELLRNSPNRTISVGELAAEFLFHKAASRCSDLRKLGHDIRYIKGETVMEGKYQLIYDASERPTWKIEGEQYVLFGGVN